MRPLFLNILLPIWMTLTVFALFYFLNFAQETNNGDWITEGHNQFYWQLGDLIRIETMAGLALSILGLLVIGKWMARTIVPTSHEPS